MDWYSQRKKDLDDNLSQNLELLKDLEDDLLYEGDAQKRKQIKRRIEEIKKTIAEHEAESNKITEKISKSSNLALAMADITFYEIDIVTKGILQMPTNEVHDFILTPPTEKMSKNNLSHLVQQQIKTGLGQSVQVKKFIENTARVAPEFPERLRGGFIRKYNELRQSGVEGDKLFEYLHNFASRNSEDFNLKLAGLAVLSYFFERCEIFEK